MKDYKTPEQIKQEAQNLIDYKSEMRNLYASRTNSNGSKKLFVTGTGSFIVEFNGKPVLETYMATPAVEKFFNELELK